MVAEDTLALMLRRRDIAFEEQTRKKMRMNRLKLDEVNYKLEARSNHAAKIIQTYWRNNYIIKKRLSELLSRHEKLERDNAMRSRKVKYIEKRYKEALIRNKKKRIEKLKRNIKVEKEHYKAIKIRKNRSKVRAKFREYESFRNNVEEEMLAIKNDRFRHIDEMEEDNMRLEQLYATNIDEIERDLKACGSSSTFCLGMDLGEVDDDDAKFFQGIDRC